MKAFPSGYGLGILCVVLAGCAPASPGGAPTGRARALLDAAPGEWIAASTPHARLHLLRGSWAAETRVDPSSRVEAARSTVLKRLGLDDYPSTLDVFYVGDRGDMRRFTGFGVTGYAWPGEDTVMLVYNADWRAFERHEFTHIIAASAWGTPIRPDPAMSEGLAVLVDGECAGVPVDRVVRTMDARGLLLPLDRLLGSFRAEDDLVAYLEAGSLLGYVESRVGIAGLRRAWAGGMASLPAVTGLAPADLQRQWLAGLRSTWEPLSGSAWNAIRAGGCGISLP